MISREHVKHIANLARIRLTEQEIEKMQKDLSKILDYFETLKKADVSNVGPTFYPSFLKNITREDKVRECPLEILKEMLSLAKETENGYFKVKEILTEEENES